MPTTKVNVYSCEIYFELIKNRTNFNEIEYILKAMNLVLSLNISNANRSLGSEIRPFFVKKAEAYGIVLSIRGN